MFKMFKEKRGQLTTSSDGRYVLTKPLNSWDTNYHFIDTYNTVDYLIDIDDIGYNGYDTYNDDELEDIIIFYTDMLELDNNVDMIIESSWKKHSIRD